MKAISIRQPWAWLVVNGHKDVENRTWRTKHRERQDDLAVIRLLVVASQEIGDRPDE